MASKLLLIIAVALTATCINGNPVQGEGIMNQLLSSQAASDSCPPLELAHMMTSCMFTGAGISSVANIMLLPRDGGCPDSAIDCASVVETRRCVVSLSISDGCKSQMSDVSDYNFELLGLPCRVSDFVEKCRDDLVANNLHLQ